MLHPELLAFQARLEAAGFVAVRHADHVCVRLALLCSVRVRYDGARLTFEPRVGAASRTAVSVSTFGIAVAAVTGLVGTAAALPFVVAAGTLSALGVGWDALRYVLTEGAITRATLLWALAHPAGAPVVAFPAPANPPAPGALPPPSPERAGAHVERGTPVR